MDIWRYSDWWGLGAEVRNSQKHIWHWRDWIIESLNADKGYDQMVREMLAADELYPNDLDRLRATGFLARQYFKFNRNTWLDETVEHTSKAFLGLTLNCAKCHDHKYDPIAQQDYYRFRAFFEPYQVRTDMVPGETDLREGRHPARLRLQPRRADVPASSAATSEQPRQGPAADAGLAARCWPSGELDIQPVTLPPRRTTRACGRSCWRTTCSAAETTDRRGPSGAGDGDEGSSPKRSKVGRPPRSQPARAGARRWPRRRWPRRRRSRRR